MLRMDGKMTRGANECGMALLMSDFTAAWRWNADVASPSGQVWESGSLGVWKSGSACSACPYCEIR